MLYSIGFEKITINAPIGVFPIEKELLNTFEIDIEVKCLKTKAFEDQLNNTVDYVKVYSIIRRIFTTPFDLIETAGEKIIEEIHTISDQVQKVHLKIKKLNPPVNGMVHASYIILEK